MSQYLDSDEGNTVIDGRENEASSSTSSGQASRKVDTFVHAPLLRHQDNTPIRLLQICNDSTEDDIRLAIHHTHDWTKGKSHRTTYTCLSYRWGDDQATRRISVDGKAKYVRENLYDFLTTWTRKDKDAKKRLWIDALCIDQSNVVERNHQVQKMGEIYETAEEVIIWLGKSPAIDRHLRAVFSTLRQQVPSGIESLCRIFDSDQAFYLAEAVLRIILWNNYWNRAWITQEIYLARKKTLAMNDQTIPLETFFQRLDDYGISAGKGYHEYNACMEMKAEMSKPRASSLVCLLSHFRNKLCSVPRDRIFSLLSICADGDQFEVDYELPKEELMYKVLRNSSEILCFCTAATVAQNLNIDYPSQPTDAQPGFQGYLLKDLLVRDLKWKTQRALYMANDHIEYGNEESDIISLFDYTICLELCSHNRSIYVSWNEYSTNSQCMPVWTDRADEQGGRKTIIACTYGDGFEFLRKAYPKRNFEDRSSIRKKERLIRSKIPDTLAAIFEEEFEEDMQVQMSRNRSKATFPPRLGLFGRTKWAVHISFSVLAKLTPGPIELCRNPYQDCFVSNRFKMNTAND